MNSPSTGAFLGQKAGGSTYKGYYDSLLKLQTKYPTGVNGEYANVNGIIYYWNGTAWVTTNIPSNSIMDSGGDVINPATTEDILKILRHLSSLRIMDSSGRQRIAVDIMPTVTVAQATAANLNATVTFAANQDIRTVATVSNITNLGGMGAELLQRSCMRNAFANSVRSRLSYN